LFNVDYKIKFHGKLYEMTGNETLKGFQKLFLPIFQYFFSGGLISKPIAYKKYVSHKGLVDVIRQRDPGSSVKPCAGPLRTI
jgi:DNA-binding FadR family transcriptional regulator